MAKSKNTAPTETVAPSQAGGKFRRLSAVTLPCLKIEENVPAFILITGAMETKPKAEKDGTVKEITIVPIVNLETGEVMSMVAGKALEQNLKDYKGGNGKYIGLCFEVTKGAAAPGKTWKPWTIFEIEKPNGV